MTPEMKKRFTAALDLIGHTGTSSAQIRYSDDEQPCVWFIVAIYPNQRWETAAGHNPLEAVERLCERLIDGGTCTHCGNVTTFDPDPSGASPMDSLWCAYRWDPELSVYRRTCEGAAT